MLTIQKWGNSLAIRIPQALAGQLSVKEGAAVELQVRGGELTDLPFVLDGTDIATELNEIGYR